MKFALHPVAAAAVLALSTAALAFEQLNREQEQGQKILSGGKGETEAERRESPLDDDFEAFVREALDRWHVPGVAVAVVDGEDTWAEGYGISSFPSTPVTPSTLFYTGSTTKAFTAAIVSLLIASGNFSSPENYSPLGWQTPISHLIKDDFVLLPEYEWPAAHLTLEDALSHRTGFPRHDKALAKKYGPDQHPGTVRDVVRSLRYLPMVSEPRVTWRYCNLMFMVVSHVIQTLTNQWLGQTMRERIWEPLGMDSTYLSVEQALEAGEQIAESYYWDYVGESDADEGHGDGKGFVKVPQASLDLASGAGGIVSNVLDYAQWIRCLIRGDGDENGCPVLPKEAHRELKAARIVLSPESRKGYDAPLAYALGWEVGTYKGHRVFTHGGSMEAYGTEVYFLPDLEYGVVLMGNTELTSNFVGREVVWKLINDKLGVPEAKRFDWSDAGKKLIDRQLKLPETAVDDLDPERADPPLPPALALQEYAGVYSHPAYQNITLELIDEDGPTPTDSQADKGGRRGKLKAIRDDMEWQMTFEYIHVSGEFWAVIIDMLNTPNIITAQLARAEFVVGVKGKVDILKMEFLEDGSEGVIVFDKIV
ncbi:beta-lactamase/transpeptidase-like protein [Hypoxylon sp. FL1857]|nr:beta-lactamase/transpeptidase-like protein [Hypoxylon sp. FL1857]